MSSNLATVCCIVSFIWIYMHAQWKPYIYTYTHTRTWTHTNALQILGKWQTAYTPLWVPMPWVKLSNTFHTGSTYTTFSQWGLHWRCPFANNTIMDTHLHVHAHTFLSAHTCRHSHSDTRLCALLWINYRHFNHWTLLLWGTADIAASGQEYGPLTDFNLGLMIVVWAWMLYYYGICHFFSGCL